MNPDSTMFPPESHEMNKRGKIYSKMASGKHKHYLVDGDGNVHTVHLIPANQVDDDGDND